MSEKENLVKLTIDGHEVEVPKGTKILKAAQQLQKEIPHFCYHDGLSIVGQCRMCYVEIEGMPKLATSCSTDVGEGMVVSTNSEKVQKGQNATLEFVLLDHPLDCPICDRGGECKLQDYTYDHGPARSRMIDQKEELVKHKPVSEEVVLDQERCILCTRCVRFSAEVDGRTELVVNARGSHSVIDVFEDRPMQSNFSGNVVDLCPVGALTAQDYRFKARPWELRKHEGVCSGCAVGCNIEIHTKHRHPGIPRPDGTVAKPHVERLVPRENLKVNDYWMCDEGRWGYHYHNRDDKRIVSPMIRRSKGAELTEVSFKEMQLLLDKAFEEQKAAWEFWSTDSVTHEQLDWTRKLQQSWSERGRSVKNGMNQHDWSAKVLGALQSKDSWNEEFSFDGITKVVSTHESYRDLEGKIAILAMKMGQKVREDQLTWEKRDLGSLHSGSDDAASTLYLLPQPSSEDALKALESLPENARHLVTWNSSNSRGLANEGIAPLETLTGLIQGQTASAPVFVTAQKVKEKYEQSFVDYVKSAPFSVVVDAFHSALTENADIVLPVEAFYDSRAHVTNMLNMKQLSNGVSIQHPSFETLNKGSESPIGAALQLL